MRPPLRVVVAVVTALLAGRTVAAAPTDPAGLWLTQDRGGVIAVSNCGKHLCARIAGVVLDNPTDATPLNYQGASQCGLHLVEDATRIKPDLWRGHIRDPRNGSVWGVEIWINADGTLALRGYAGITLLGRTETWTRYPGAVPANCRMSPAEVSAAAQR